MKSGYSGYLKCIRVSGYSGYSVRCCGYLEEGGDCSRRARKHLEDCHRRPQERVEVFPVTDSGVGVTELAAEEVHAEDAKDEDEEHEEAEEDGHVVHGAEHHDQLSPEVRQEADQLQDSQQAEGPEQRFIFFQTCWTTERLREST